MMEIGDLVKWIGGSYHDLQGIVVETRLIGGYGREQKVIWETHTLGSLKADPNGSWQREHNLKVISSLEKNDESR